MALKKYNPTTPASRFKSTLDYSDLDKVKPLKSLLAKKKRISGRGYRNHISVRRRGGGNKKRYRIIDFMRNKDGIDARVVSIEYDPNRGANIALLCYMDGEKRYILAPNGVKAGDVLRSGGDAEIKVGNAMPLDRIPFGMAIHNVELKPGKGGQIARGAGTSCLVLGREGKYAMIRMPSGETRRVLSRCRATIGEIGNKDRMNVRIGKAGKSRWLGRRPKVRGVAMNPIDHPHGGGEGRTSGGRHPVSPTAKPTKGMKTRNPKKYSAKFIVKRRK